MDITTKVAEQITNANPKIAEKVIDILASKEIERRTNAVVQAIGEIDKLEKDLKKFKPDVIAYSETGEIASSNWSKSKLDERNQCQSKIKKLQAILDKALDANDYGDLLNQSKNAAQAESN